ncbi:ABC transporter permease [Candidatus Woesearchaeota archaeon]|nr:ABC transporter permease [Candidatus Woesearchaeota archaeon]
MKLHKTFKFALNMVLHSKLRSWLTIIGIVIGIASVIAIISIGDGMEASVNEQITNSLATDTLTITPGYSRASSFGPPGGGHRDFGGGATSSNDDNPLTDKDIQTLKGIKEIKIISPTISGNAKAYFMGNEGSVTIMGVDQKVWSEMVTDDLDSGRYLDSADSNVIVIGYSLANDYFDKTVGLNQVIQIEGVSYRVVGILESGTRNNVYMPLNAAYAVLSDDKTKGEYDSIAVKLQDDALLNETTDIIEEKLSLSRHAIGDERDFSISDPTQFASMASDMTSTITTFLAAIAAISLLVGAVGIANTMFTSVLEKTKQIGIMKAIGAKNKDILLIFVFNAVIIGLIGGLIGLALGIFLSKLAGMALGINSIITFSTVSLAVLVSMASGLLAGFIPARQASKLKPVDSLRFE